jgi:hypothetical protein
MIGIIGMVELYRGQTGDQGTVQKANYGNGFAGRLGNEALLSSFATMGLTDFVRAERFAACAVSFD